MSTLEEQVAAIKPGDKVTARFASGNGDAFTISGVASEGHHCGSLAIGYVYLRSRDGKPDIALRSIESHEPAQPPIPPEPTGTCLVRFGEGSSVFIPLDDGRWEDLQSGELHPWPRLVDGIGNEPVEVYRPEPSPERIDQLVREFPKKWGGCDGSLDGQLQEFVADLLAGES